MFYVEAILDFHQLGILNHAQIEIAVEKFLEENYQLDKDYLLIITGQGINSNRGSVIKPIAERVLRSSKFVVKFHSATAEYGGQGAFQVYLKG